MPVRVGRTKLALDDDWTLLYCPYVNNAVASAMVQAAHRVEARLEEALAGVGLSIAKFETLSILVSQDRPISLSELAAKLVCVRSNVVYRSGGFGAPNKYPAALGSECAGTLEAIGKGVTGF